MKILFDLFPVILFFGVFKLTGINPDATQGFAAYIGYQADPAHLPVLAATATATGIIFVFIVLQAVMLSKYLVIHQKENN